jgi:hypothetical protein
MFCCDAYLSYSKGLCPSQEIAQGMVYDVVHEEFPQGTFVYHKTWSVFSPGENNSHMYTLAPPPHVMTDRGQNVLVYRTTRALYVPLDVSVAGELPLKMVYHNFFMNVCISDVIHVDIGALCTGLRGIGVEGMVSRIDVSSEIKELIICCPPCTESCPIAYVGSYLL